MPVGLPKGGAGGKVGTGPVGLSPHDHAKTGAQGPVGLHPNDHGRVRGTAGGRAAGINPNYAPHFSNHLHGLTGTLEQAGRDIKNIPGGLVQTGEAVNHDVAKAAAKLPGLGHSQAAQIGKGPWQTPKVGKAIAKSTVASVKHPLRDPFQTLLNVGAVASAGVGAVARAGGAADALRAGDLAGAAKAVVRPTVKPRVLRANGGEAALIPSRNAAVRGAQRVYDKSLQHGLDTNPAGRVATHANKRIGGALKEESRIQHAMRAAPAALLDRAASKLSKLPSVRREQQAALELASVNTGPEEAAAYHAAQAAKGVNPEQNAAVASLYRRVAEKGYLTRDEHGNVTVNPAHAKLLHADTALQRVQRQGDKTLVERGVREPGALEARVNAPGRVRAGAEYVKTPAAKGRVAQVREYPGKTKTVTRTMTPDEVHARLTELDARHAALVQKIIPEVSPYGGILSKQEQLARNFTAGKGIKPTTVGAEERDAADARLRQVVANNPDHPAVQRVAAMLAERDRMRQALTAHGEASLEGRAAEPLPTISREVPGKTRRVALKAVAPQRASGGFVGGETAAPGRGFISYRQGEKKLSRAEASASPGPVVGAARSPIENKTFEGRAIEQGLPPKNVTASASRNFRQIAKFENTDAIRRRALEFGSATKRSANQILVRNPDEKAGEITAKMRQALGQETSAHDTAEELATQEGLQAAHEVLLDHVMPGLKEKFKSDRGKAIGAPATPGHRWVDRNMLGDLTRQPLGPKPAVVKWIDDVNSGVTAATVYFKVGHLGTRVFTNAVTNIVQGSAAPRQIGKAVSLWHQLDEGERARALAASGQHGFASLPHDTASLVGRVAGRGAQWWARHADSRFRFNSLAYEMRRIGYGSPAKFRKALDALQAGGRNVPRDEWHKISVAARAADREAISYDRLSDFEKRYISRAFWFYPWVKGASSFAGRTALEHPYKAAALGNEGAQGQQQQLGALGLLPTYESGLVPLAGGARPLVTDLNTFSPFGTPADLMFAAGRPKELGGFLNPAYGAAVNLLTGVNQFGQQSRSPIKDAGAQLVSPTPEAQVIQALLAGQKGQQKRMFPKNPAFHSTLDPLMRMLLGPAVPRRLNPQAAHKAYGREKIGR